MNATGKSDMKVYYEKIGQLQQTCLRPVLEKLLPVMEISAFGYNALDLELVFEPISNATLAEFEIMSIYEVLGHTNSHRGRYLTYYGFNTDIFFKKAE